MNRPPHTSALPPAPVDEAEEAREMAEFFQRQHPADVAAADWHTRSEQGLSPGEQAEFADWMQASAEHAAAFGRIEQGVAALRGIDGQRLTRPRATFAAQAAQAPAVALETVRGGLPRQSARRLVLAWLAARPALVASYGVLLLALGVGWHHWLRQPTFEYNFAVARGEHRDLTLPDGSELALDADTRGTVALYRDRREVRISEGQIMFSVAPNSAQPFRVQAGPARVTVVGTRFSVRYRSDGMDAGVARVAVEHGQVRVAGLRTVDLTAGQALTVAADGEVGALAAVSPGSVALWRKGLVRFENTPLAQALLELERYGPTGVVVNDPVVAAMPVGGSYRIGQPLEFARMMGHILPVKLVPRAGGATEIVGTHEKN